MFSIEGPQSFNITDVEPVESPPDASMYIFAVRLPVDYYGPVSVAFSQVNFSIQYASQKPNAQCSCFLHNKVCNLTYFA